MLYRCIFILLLMFSQAEAATKYNVYGTGTGPAVALQDNVIVETHKSENFDSLYSNIGVLKQGKKVVWY